MSGAQELERSVLERKERDELHTIAEALGVKPGTRTKKADLIRTILVAAGVEPDGAEPVAAPEPAADAKPRRTRATKAKAVAAEPEGSADVDVDTAPEQQADPERQPAPEATMPDATMADATMTEALGVDEAAAEAAGDDSSTPASNGRSERSERPASNTQAANSQAGNSQAGNSQAGNNQAGGAPAGAPEEGQSRRSRRRRGRDQRGGDRDFRVQEQNADQQYQGDLVPVAGLLDLTEQGYGYVRAKGYLPSSGDVYVSTSQTKRFALRKGDYVEGEARPPVGSEKYGALLRLDKVAGMTVDDARNRARFDELTPLFPDVKLRMEMPSQPGNITARIIDIISPVGKGQRGLIVSPPKAGKTTVIKQIATSIEANNPDVHLMILLVDERPEEVTDMRRHVKGEVVASTFDRPAEEHTQLAELAIERAKRLVEAGQDVVIILDGITRLARAYNLSAPPSGRLTSGGIDQAAIYPPKKFFGAARNIEEGGSLTILATALVETGSKADDVIFEEFKGTGNMELRLDRRLAERRIYPAIDVNASSTRHEELLFERKQLELVYRLRRVLNGLSDDGSAARSLELLIEKIKTTKDNDEFLAEVAKAQGASI